MHLDDSKLMEALHDNLNQSFLRGSRFLSRRDHSYLLLAKVATALNLELSSPYDVERDLVQHRLASLMDLDVVPQTHKDWKAQLSKFCSSTDQRRQIYRLLAVDGFRGDNLTLYLGNVLDFMQCYFVKHVRAVRTMYDTIAESPLKHLEGEDIARVVFLALLKTYGENIIIFDDMVKMTMQRAYRDVEGCLHGKAHYYRDARIIDDDDLLKSLGDKYRAEFGENDDEWQYVAKKMLTKLVGTYWNNSKQKLLSSGGRSGYKKTAAKKSC